MDIFVDFSLNALLDKNINVWNIILRMLVSLLFGGFIGFTQEKGGRPAGLRTHIVLSLGTTIVTITSIYISQEFSTGDPGRIAAQIVSGIGFLGAGAIIKYGFNIIGMTSAASIWTTSAIGMAAGMGMYFLGLLGTVLLVVTLSLLIRFENKIVKIRKKQYRLSVSFKNLDIDLLFNNIENLLKSFGIKITTFSFITKKTEGVTTLDLSILLAKYIEIFTVIKEIHKMNDLRSIELKDN